MNRKRSPLADLGAYFVDPEYCPECGQTIFRYRRGPKAGKIRPHVTPAGMQAKRIGPGSYCPIDGGKAEREAREERVRQSRERRR